jgi:hypothetical protein
MRSGNIIDETGKMNNFAIEPEVYVDAVARTGFTEYAEKLNVGSGSSVGSRLSDFSPKSVGFFIP